MLTTLERALRTRFGRTGSLADLDEAIQADQDALAAAPGDHPNRAIVLSDLGVALQSRFAQTGSPTDLDEAIRFSQEAVTATPSGHAERAASLASLGQALWSRFGQTGELADLDEAIRLIQDAARLPLTTTLTGRFGSPTSGPHYRAGSRRRVISATWTRRYGSADEQSRRPAAVIPAAPRC